MAGPLVEFEAMRADAAPDPERVTITNIGESPLIDLATSVRYREGPSSWPETSTLPTPQSRTVSFGVVPCAAADATSDSPQGEGALFDK